MSDIYNPERFEQAALRKGLRKLGVASTDVDLVIDLDGKAVIYVELKTKGTPLEYAQKRLFINLLKNSTVPAFLIVAAHDTEPSEEICPVAYVEEVYFRFPDEGEGFNWEGFDTDYDGDLMSLNHFLSALTWTYCPRLLNRYHELPAWDECGPLWKILGLRAIKTEEDRGWQYSLNIVATKIGGINVAPSVRETVNSWTDDELKAYLAKYGVKTD